MSKNDEGIDILTFEKDLEIAKFNGIYPVGWSLLVRLYTAPVKQNGLYTPATAHDEQQYKNCVGLVIDMSPGAYKDERYKETGPWCKIGDWVIFPRHGGSKIYCDGLPCFFLKEDAIDGITDDPRRINK